MNEKATYEINLRDQFSPKLQGAVNGINQFEKKVANLSGNGPGSFGGLSKAIGAAFTVSAIGAGLKRLSDMGAAAESVRTSYQVMLGDIKKGDKLLGELKNYAISPPTFPKMF